LERNPIEPPHDTLGSLLARAHDLESCFDEAMEGSAEAYLCKVNAEVMQGGDKATVVQILETKVSKLEYLRQSLENCEADILEKAACIYKWWEVRQLAKRVHTVVCGLQEILCEVW
jgi:hypothetical protein